MKTIYVGNIPFHSTEKEVRSVFTRYGSVASVKLVTDKKTGRSRGFGFIEMEEPAAKDAIHNLDGQKFGGRFLRVLEAKAHEADKHK
jgi:RNA recognition motif-containing protein